MFIAPGFGKDAGCGNAGVDAIAFDDALVGNALVGGESVAIYQEQAGLHAQLGYGEVHGFEGGFEDVDLVNFCVADLCDGPGECFFFDDYTEFVAGGFVELLGVVQDFVLKRTWKDDGCGEYRAGETSAAGFVAACFYEFFL